MSRIFAQLFLVPLGFVAIGIFARRLGRRDGDTSPQKNDFAAGTTVYLMTIGKIVSDVSQMSSHTDETYGWLVTVLILTFFSIDHDRFRSWEIGNDGQMKNAKRLWIGVVLPTFISFLTFFCYQLRVLSLTGAFGQ